MFFATEPSLQSSFTFTMINLHCPINVYIWLLVLISCLIHLYSNSVLGAVCTIKNYLRQLTLKEKRFILAQGFREHRWLFCFGPLAKAAHPSEGIHTQELTPQVRSKGTEEVSEILPFCLNSMP